MAVFPVFFAGREIHVGVKITGEPLILFFILMERLRI